jgi:thiol-disulfide isomerase/thioredoxin
VFPVLLVLAGCYTAPDAAKIGPMGGPAALVGAPAQSFDVKRTDGIVDGLAQHRGSVVLLNLWASWCPPCQAEMPALEHFSRLERGKVVVLGADQGESAGVAAAYAKAHGVTFPILVDEAQHYGNTYAAAGLPTTIIVGRDGHVVTGIDGALTLAQMRAAVAPALK